MWAKKAEECKMQKLRLRHASVKVDKRYHVTSDWLRACSATSNQRQGCVIWYQFSCQHFNVPDQLCVRLISWGRNWP